MALSMDLVYTPISMVVSTTFLMVLLVLSLCHNVVEAHFKKKDPRDTRSSNIRNSPKNHSRESSVGSATPLGIGRYEMGNIEYDHDVTCPDTRPDTVFENSAYQPRPVGINENPFNSVLNAEDLKLVPDLQYYFEEYGIAIEKLEIQTLDGFIIDLWHLKPKVHLDSSKSGHPMLLLHGLLQSSGSFASGGRKSLAYYFYESGYDIWLGNNRCGFKPKWNDYIVKKKDRWNWDMRDLVQYDLRALVSTVLEKTGKEKLTLIAHSQGTTQGFMGLANGETVYDDDFRLLDKLENFVALAPAVYPGPLIEEKMFVRFMSRFIDSPYVFGRRCFLPLMMLMRSLMVGWKMFSFLSYVMFNYLFDWNDSLWDKPLRNRHFLFSPVCISVNLLQWWLSQDKRKSSFKTYSNGIFPDSKTWFPSSGEPAKKQTEMHSNQEKNTTQEYPRILMFIPKQDRLVDGERLINHFTNCEPRSLYKIWYIDEYSHLDVLWSHDVIERVGKPILNTIRANSPN
ncbi:LAQU0S05e00694g1_1 [Lachancea quebecensis]|uniref:sterol esterase n=1 Tax=Lachancea quebecensis TaxID=1654605 RepID=A0A0P1KQG7_9SACH|nr:LAQU0S05e00694g1_1 [Lachancea quebecensis]